MLLYAVFVIDIQGQILYTSKQEKEVTINKT